jgi:hypothetical protein
MLYKITIEPDHGAPVDQTKDDGAQLKSVIARVPGVHLGPEGVSSNPMWSIAYHSPFGALVV